MAKKATHQGSCQGCGHTQKLPGGKLSLHGYTTRWGFFQGVCAGAKELPYEQSCDYCKKQIVWSEAQVERQLEVAKHHRREIAEPIADFVSIRIGFDRRAFEPIIKHVSAMVLTEKEMGDEGHRYVEIFGAYEHEGETKTISLSGVNGLLYYERPKSALEAAKMLNEIQAKKADLLVEQIREYIKWQQERVANWKLTPLQEIEKAVDEPGKGDLALLKTLFNRDEVVECNDRSCMYSKSVELTRAQRLVRFGLAENVGTGRNNTGSWMRIRITDAGRSKMEGMSK